jgi:hypothetical protein
MPRGIFKQDFFTALTQLNLVNRGFGSLYVDDQACNLDNLDAVLVKLAKWYEVSKIAAEIRLKHLNLLNDRRSTPAHISGHLKSLSGVLR